MLVKDVFKIIGSINQDFKALKKEILGNRILELGVAGNRIEIEEEIIQLDDNLKHLMMIFLM